MSVAKVSELICESTKSFEDAVAQGVARANKTLRNVTEAWVQSQKVIITKGKISGYRVILRVTFVLDD
jgi:flavin-binding protein dodecin